MENDLAPIQALKNLMKFWWVVVALMILGGGVGLFITRLQPPIYESSATISTALDYAFLSRLDDWEEDQIFQSVGDIIVSTSVLDKVIETATADGTPLTQAEIAANFSADRQDTRWVIRVRNANPQLAQKWAQLWSQEAISALSNLHKNTVVSVTVQSSLNSLVNCLQDKVVADASSALCPNEDSSTVTDQIATLANDPELKPIWNSLALSHTSFELTNDANLPSAPVLFGRNICVLTGALIGLLLGVVLVNSGLLNKKTA
jgi:predicted regulator of amino acid metabolism with ACT domain